MDPADVNAPERRRKGTHCPRCGSTHLEMTVRTGAIFYVCLECANEWPERRISSIVQEHSSVPGEAIHRAVESICAARELDILMAATRMWARQLTAADGVTFVLRAGETCYCADEDAIAPLWKGQRFPLGACISGWVMMNRQSVLIPDIYADPRVPQETYRPTFVKSLLMVPVRKADPIAAIGAYWKTPHAPTPADVQVMELLAEAATVGLAREQMSTRVIDVARHG